MSADSASDVSGPVAMMTGPSSAGGNARDLLADDA